MNYNFNFENDKDFFKTSSTLKKIQETLLKRNFEFAKNSKLAPVVLKLWAETVIKHNFSISNTRVDPIDFITDENSQEVKNIFGKIISKDKSKRTEADFKILQAHSYVNGSIVLACHSLYSKGNDPFANLKDEYVAYKNELSLQLDTSSKKKIKMGRV